MTDEIELYSEFCECSLQLVQWAKGTDLLEDILEQIEMQIATLRQLHQWKRTYLLLPKPTLSTSHTFVFWVYSSIVDAALRLTGVQGGFKVSQNNTKLPDSSTYRGKKQTPRPRRVLLDIGCDDPTLIQALTQQGLEVELVWRHAADLLNYEIIEICTAQYIDLFVSSNHRLLTPPEEWLTFLMPHRTRLFFPSQKLVESPKVLARAIFERVWTKRKRKRVDSHQLQLEFFSTLDQKTVHKGQSKGGSVQ